MKKLEIMNYETKIKNLLAKYHSLNNEILDYNGELYDINLYDMDGYWNDEDFSEANYKALSKRVKAIKKLIEAYKLVNEAITIYA